MHSRIVQLLAYVALCQASPSLLQSGVFTRKFQRSDVFLKADAGSTARFEPPWEDQTHHASPRLTCGVTEQVGAQTDKYEDCPANCPYFAQNRQDDKHCTFLCVPGAECGRWNPNKPIPDSIKNTKTCRGPKVAFCSEPQLDGSDTCKKCQSGFALHEHDGQCYFSHWTAIIAGLIIFVVLMVSVLAWFLDMVFREPCNEGLVKKALAWRSRSKIMDRRTPGNIRTFDLDTNLCETDVAGPGMLLHFRFQRFFIIWPFCVALVWCALACFHNELWILGTRKFGTPRHNCILVAWGYETQQRLMWTKVLFLAIVYVGSFISFLWFSVSQRKQHQKMDGLEKTQKDFAVEINGLPPLPATHRDVEGDIQKAVEAALGNKDLKVVGVSVAWNYDDDGGELQEMVDYLCNTDLNRRKIEWEMTVKNKAKGKKPPTDKEVDEKVAKQKAKHATDPSEDYPPMRKWMYSVEKNLLGPDPDKEDDVPEDVKDKQGHLAKELLGKITSSDVAFVVFETEPEKMKALEILGEKVITIDTSKYGIGQDKAEVSVKDVSNEPSNLNWHNFGNPEPIKGFFKGFFTVYIPALLVWFFGFYCPYAWSLYNFNYDNGAELPGYYSIIFTIVVCGGNATMYVVCDICCDICGFRYKDTKQVAYMLMYLCACMINVFLDMVVTYVTAYKVMVGLDFRTYHGTRLADIDVFTEQFETYAMQRSLGGNTYAYAWPSTFFLCFVIEPIVTILVPYYLGKVIIRTHKEINGICSEAYLMAFEFDLGRYADILLNVFLGILIFYFPGGYIWSLFFAMTFSHCFIYSFDHWRVLKVIPYIKIVSMAVDWWAQVTMAFCCATIMGCLVFKMNCETYAGYCLQEMGLISATWIAGLSHFIVHVLLLVYLVPILAGQKEDEKETETFKEAASKESRTWFSVNPIHCLRSQHIQQQSPHCRLCMWGKEHLLEKNEKIGCYYVTDAAAIESYEFRSSIRDALNKGKDAPEESLAQELESEDEADKA